MAVNTDDAFAAEDLDPFNLNPSTGVDPTRAIRNVGTAAQTIGTDPSQDVILPLSITGAPRGVQYASLAPPEGQVVNLAAASPVNLSAPQEVAPVVPPASVAVPVQTGQSATRGVQVAQAGPPSALPSVTLPGSQPVPVAPPQGPGPVQYPGKGQGAWGQDAPPPVPVNPNANPKIQELRTIDGQIAKASGDANAPSWYEALYPSVVNAAKEKLKTLNQRKDQLQGELQNEQTNQQDAANWHLSKDMGAKADRAAHIQEALREAREEGNFGAITALEGAGMGGLLAPHMADAMKSLGKDTAGASKLYGDLDKAMGNETDYAKARADVLKAAKNNWNYNQFGLTDSNLPRTGKEYMDQRNTLQAKSNAAGQRVLDYQTALANQNVPKDVPETIQKSIQEDNKFSNGDPIPVVGKQLPTVGNLTLGRSTVLDPAEYRPDGKYNDWGAAQKATGAKMISENPEVRGVLDQHNMAVDFNKYVQNDDNYKDVAGRTLIADSSAGIFRNMSEMARASGNISLLKVLEHEMGTIGYTLNKSSTEWGAFVNWMNSDQKGDKPPIPRQDEWSKEVKDAFKRIGALHLKVKDETLSRLSGVADYVGQHAGKLTDVGISTDAAKVLEPRRELANQQARIDLDSADRINMGKYSYRLSEGQKVPEGTAGFVPRGSYKASIDALNARPPAAQPVAPSGGRPAAPGALPSSTPGGGGALSGTIPAGTFTNVPASTAPPPPNTPANFNNRFNAIGNATTLPGATIPPVPPPAPVPGRRSMLDNIITPARAEAAPQPDAEALRNTGLAALRSGPQQPAAPPAFDGPSYKAGIGRGESNNNYAAPPPRDAQGGLLSTASGKYQMIDQTWNAHKPPGATAIRAMDATPAQQEAANDSLILENSQALTKAGLPVNNFTMSVAHNLGSGKKGAEGLLTAPDNDTALKYVDRKAAANNPQFFWEGGNGRLLTVAESKAKYADFYNTNNRTSTPAATGGAVPVAQPAAPAAAAPQPAASSLWDRLNPAAAKSAIQDVATETGAPQAYQTIANQAPLIGGVAGGVAGGPVGAAVGSGIGGLLKHAATAPPEQQNLKDYAVTGGAEAATGALYNNPVTGLVSRVVGGTAIPAVEEYLKSGDSKKAGVAAVGGFAGSVLGEGLGATISKAVGETFKRLDVRDQDAIKQASQVLATQKPTVMDAAGRVTVNPAYTAAEQTVKSKGYDPQVVANAFNETAKGSKSYGEAMANRPANVAKLQAGQSMDQVVNAVGAQGAQTAPAQVQKVMGSLTSPESIVGGSKVPSYLAGDAKQAATTMAGDKPITNLGQLFDNMATARSDLLRKITNAERMSDAHPDFVHKDEIIKGLKALEDHVDQQQRKLIDGVLPGKQGDALKQHLDNARTRYYNAMQASGGDMIATIAKGGTEGLKARAALDAVAGNDPVAKRWVNAMVAAHGKKNTDLLYLLGPIGSLGGTIGAMPLIGAPSAYALGAVTGVMTVAKAKQALTNFMTNRAAGKQVTFSQMIKGDIQPVQKAIRQTTAYTGQQQGGLGAQAAINAATNPASSAPQVPISQ